MHYFVTGAKGFIGRRLVRKLLERKGAIVHFLVREQSARRVDELLEFLPTTASAGIATIAAREARINERLYAGMTRPFELTEEESRSPL
jgi:thioester reductase-like protein